MKSKNRWLPLVLLFVLVNILFLAGKNLLSKNGFDQNVLLAGNGILFLATALSFFISLRSLHSSNPNSSVRSLYGSFMIKFFVILIAAFVYIMSAKKDLNRPALFTCMGLYLVYSIIEITTLQNILNSKKSHTG